MKKKVKAKVKETKSKQLDLKLKHPFFNEFLKLKNDVKKWFTVYELKKYSKDLIVWVLLSLSVASTAFQALWLYFKLESLPNKLPILNIASDLSDRLLNRELVFIMPIVSLIILIFSYLLSGRYYEKERENSYIILFICTLSVLMICLASILIIYKVS